MTAVIYDTYSHRFENTNQPYHLQICANAIEMAGAPLTNCFGSVDSSVRPISRLREIQSIAYNNHKRIHQISW